MLLHYQDLTEVLFEFSDSVTQKLDRLHFKKDQIIYFEGSTPLGAYLIEEGKVKISKTNSNGKTTILRIAIKNEVINYTDIFSNTSYSSSAIAMEDSTFLFIPKAMFLELVKEQAQLCDELLKKLSLDKKQMEARIVDFAYKPVRGRLAEALLALHNKINKDKNSNSLYISRTDLACYVGTARETVNRLLSEFRHGKLVQTNRNTEIELLDLSSLKKIAETDD